MTDTPQSADGYASVRLPLRAAPSAWLRLGRSGRAGRAGASEESILPYGRVKGGLKAAPNALKTARGGREEPILGHFERLDNIAIFAAKLMVSSLGASIPQVL